MSQAAKIFLSLLAYRVGELPLSAAVLLAAGLLWWSIALFASRKKSKTMPGCGWLPPFLCTAAGGGLLLLFCEDFILAAGLLFAAALLYALLWRLVFRSAGNTLPEGGDGGSR